MKLKDALEWMLIETAPVALTSKYGQSAQEAVRKHLENIEYAESHASVGPMVAPRITASSISEETIKYGLSPNAELQKLADQFHSDLVWNTALFAKVTKLSTAMEEGGISVGDIFKIDNARPDNKVWVSSMDGFTCWLHRDNLEPYDMVKQGEVSLTSVDKIRGRKVEREVAIFRKNLKVGMFVKFKLNGLYGGGKVTNTDGSRGFISGYGWIERERLYPANFKYQIK